MNFLALSVRQNLIFFIVLSLGSTNERFYKIDQCFRCTIISYFYSVIPSAFIDSKDEIL
jgi:hypothetical protein